MRKELKMRVKTAMMGVVSAVLLVACGVPQEKYDADMKALNEELAKAQDELANASAELSSLRNDKGSIFSSFIFNEFF